MLGARYLISKQLQSITSMGPSCLLIPKSIPGGDVSSMLQLRNVSNEIFRGFYEFYAICLFVALQVLVRFPEVVASILISASRHEPASLMENIFPQGLSPSLDGL